MPADSGIASAVHAHGARYRQLLHVWVSRCASMMQVCCNGRQSQPSQAHTSVPSALWYHEFILQLDCTAYCTAQAVGGDVSFCINQGRPARSTQC
jgi:hypothetical protein